MESIGYRKLLAWDTQGADSQVGLRNISLYFYDFEKKCVLKYWTNLTHMLTFICGLGKQVPWVRIQAYS